MQVVALKHIIFLFLALLSLTPLISSSYALVLGLLMALLGWVPPQINPSAWVKRLLAIAIVGLGFGVNLSVALEASINQLGLLIAVIVSALLLGWGLIRLTRMQPTTGALISAGTAICGGSAIAALAPAIRARSEYIGVALACVFVLNAIALWVFPAVGHFFQLSQQQFGVWAALAIHDTSSVVAAAELYGEESLAVATTLKLTRALAIVPLVFVAAWWYRRQHPEAEAASKLPAIPLFIVLYVLAIVIAEFIPQGEPLYTFAFQGARHLLALCLFLIGASLSVTRLQQAGLKPILVATVLWLMIASGTLWWVLHSA
ncbi:putative sulfate exporter family transporter [Aliidiomarina halalkaliphila]|uniref:Putative sulfate exporter family transporter n=1 Tax=Aliidiomarina halalkaliphila TaxID=2593535 RepID=A0A552X1E8_9GAMM|nr:putative sulfate exporter family transporter [Aliidiomarina halalkaliphila]TRW48870.1 putative sulfate exporter family transporter [Aliidiomarina halalkaliphila]